MTVNLVVNARFATRQLSGVDRVAVELTKALLALGSEGVSLSATGPNADVVTPLPINIERGRFRGHIWEQIELPIRHSKDYLLNLCNTGPAAFRNQAVIIHDAQTYLEPGAYSWAFRSWYKLLLPRLARRAQLVLTISEYSRAKLEQFGVIPPGKARILPNGADHILSIESDPNTLARYGLERGATFSRLAILAPTRTWRC
ncbi:glycosyltransferase [Caulobacter sp. BP25]|uniref:glycosyltransferase n=1 Tax=Caulobacter sp. BP25 TaxID=2048900 RepID=UPI000C12CDDA|nr:hypothetical protein CSW59_00495 [Caulobacter sp. BP25]